MSGTNESNFQQLKLVFENENWAGVGDASGLQGSTVPGSLYVSLHSADPGETGLQNTNEITVGEYAEYVRIAVARSPAAWTAVLADPARVSNDAPVLWPEMTAGTGQTVTHFGVGVALSGSTALLYFGPIDSAILLDIGVIVEFEADKLAVTVD